MGRLAGWIGIASYALVALLGLWLILRKLFGWGHAHDHGHHGHDHHGHGHEPHAAITDLKMVDLAMWQHRK